MSNDNLAAESVASKILAMVAEVGLRDTTLATPESVLGRDLGLDYLDVVELIIDVEREFDIDLSPSIGEEDDEDFMVGLTVQAVIDATMNALAGEGRAESTTASIPVEDIKPALLVADGVAPKLTPADIEAVIVAEHYFTGMEGFAGYCMANPTFNFLPRDGLETVTFCVLILRNGAKVTGVNHGPVSAANFDAGEGRKRARESAIEKVWELEGYLLRERLGVQLDERPLLAVSKALSAINKAAGGRLHLPIENEAKTEAVKGAQLLAIVREFVEKHRISFPEVIHQTDRVIENAYGLIQDLVDVAGYLPEEDEA